jgi:GT2 family glycosyltransferase
MPTSPILSIIIVNYNAASVLTACLNSILESKLAFPYEVFVIDNASDESIEELTRKYPFARFIFNTSNDGFASANNVGISRAMGKYILLLNPDTIVNADSFKPMIAYMDGHPDVGIVGCKIFNANGQLEHSTHSFPSLLKEFVHANEFVKAFIAYNSRIVKLFKKLFNTKAFESYWDHDAIREVDHVTGACMMVRKQAINSVGLLDEAFFLYNEEVEWSYRMKRAGYKSVFLPDSNIIHLFGYSTKQQVQKQVVNRLLVERYRGMFYFFQKHYGFAKLFILRLIVIQGFTLRLLLSYIRKVNPFRRSPFLSQDIEFLGKIVRLAFATHFDWRGER